MIVNLNCRVLTDNTVYCQYEQDGKSKSGSHPNWSAFLGWLAEVIK